MYYQNRRYLLTAVAIALIIGIIWWGRTNRDQNKTKDEYRIGAALALTGDAAPWGGASLKAAQLAIQEINEKGGINNKQLSLVVEDTKSTSKDSVSAVSKLVNTDKVQAVMITWLDSYQGAENVVPKDILLISQDAAVESVNIPTNHPNVFSTWYRTKSKSKATLDAITANGAKNVFIVTQNDSYYATLRSFLKEEAAKRGVTIVGEEVVQPDTDTRTLITKLSSTKPTAIFFAAYDEGLAIDFLKRYHEQIGERIPLFGDEFIEQDFNNQNIDKAWLEGISFYLPSEPKPDFRTKYMAKYSQEPAFSAGTTYDTVFVITQYLRDNPSDINTYMRQATFNTITYGNITFDEIGGVVSQNEAISTKKIIDGKSVPNNND